MRPLLFLTIFSLIGFSTPVYAQDKTYTITGDTYFGCTEKKDFNDVVKLLSQGDQEAFQQALGFGISMGVCTIFKKGETVYTVQPGFASVKVRRKGEVAEYWTFMEAIH